MEGFGSEFFALTKFDLKYELAKGVKGQVMSDFVTQHCKQDIQLVEPMPWTLFFDGFSCKQGSGIGIVIISPKGAGFEFTFLLEPIITNSQAEYETILKGLRLLHEIKVNIIEVFGDSQLVVS